MLKFQPTRPLRGATDGYRRLARYFTFQPTRPLRGATPRPSGLHQSRRDFNPRAPCGARPIPSTQSPATSVFQPTRPLRGATLSSMRKSCSRTAFQPTRPLRGATTVAVNSLASSDISTHAPLAGRDRFAGRSATVVGISTHAPLAGRDITSDRGREEQLHFNPRAPCGARRSESSPVLKKRDFNPRAPCGARPRLRSTIFSTIRYFNPRAPCGARHKLTPLGESWRNFNPRAPCGARPTCLPICPQRTKFQPTRPLRGATAKVYKLLCTFLR